MGDGIDRSVPFRSVSLARHRPWVFLMLGLGRIQPGRLHRLPPVGRQAILVELEGAARRDDDKTARAVAPHPASPLPDASHRVGQPQVEAHLQVGDVDAHLHGAGAGDAPNVSGTQRLLDPLPLHQPGAIRHGVPGLHDDGVLGDAAGGLDARSGALRQLPVVHKGDVRPVGIVVDDLPHRCLQVPPALVVGFPSDGVLHRQLRPGAAVVAVIHHLEGQAGQGLQVLGRVVDGGAGRDHS